MNSEDPCQTAPSALLSSLGICHKSDECPPTRARHRCKSDLSDRCVRKDACYTAENTEKAHIVRNKRIENLHLSFQTSQRE